MRSLKRVEGHPWPAPPTRAIRYPVVERLADWFAGRRDGVLGIPPVPVAVLDVGASADRPESEASAEVGTPRLE
jgi:hypothetical protein